MGMSKMMKASGRDVRRGFAVLAATIGALTAGGLALAQSDPVVFSFATVGDSRTDPNKPDATTLLTNPHPTTQGGAASLTGVILPQDNEYVQNTQAFATIIANIEAQAPNLLFFNGDMIFGYGRPVIPSAWQTTVGALPNSWNATLTTTNITQTGGVDVTADFVFELQQYAYWRGLISPLFLTGTYVIPVPGNHETQCSYSAAPYSASSPNPNCNTAAQGNLTGKTAYAENETMFRMNTADLVNDLMSNLRFSNVTGFYATSVTGLTQATAPAASTNNGPITSNQADLTYSFDITPQSGLLLHFVVINTDPAGADSTAPADWLAADLAAAKARGAQKFFVFGHKPAFTYNYAQSTGGSVAPPTTNSPGPGGLDANYVAVASNGVTTYTEPFRNAFWSVIAQYNATYFSGHEHTVNVSQNADPTGANPGAPFQVIVGSGGSPFDDKLASTKCTQPNIATCEPVLTNPYDRFYAWALVQIHQSGAVSMQVNGFNDQFGPVQDLTIYDVPGSGFPGVTTLQ
jgi:Calcineurin-like phosphoesterase